MYMVLNLFKIFETIPIKDGIHIEDGIQQHFKLPIEYLETKYECYGVYSSTKKWHFYKKAQALYINTVKFI